MNSTRLFSSSSSLFARASKSLVSAPASRARLRAAPRLGAQVVLTDDYPNFRPGWWCAVQGPYIRDEANYWRGEFRRRGVGDAYVKSGW